MFCAADHMQLSPCCPACLYPPRSVLLVYFGYLSCLTLLISLYKFKDDAWRMTRFVKIGLCISICWIGMLAVAVMICE